MKVVIHSRGRDVDASVLRSRFQSASFVITNTHSEVIDAISEMCIDEVMRGRPTQ